MVREYTDMVREILSRPEHEAYIAGKLAALRAVRKIISEDLAETCFCVKSRAHDYSDNCQALLRIDDAIEKLILALDDGEASDGK